MKKTLCALLAVLSFNALADQMDQRIGERLSRLQEAYYKGDIARLSKFEKQQVSDGLQNALDAIRTENTPGPRPGPIPGPGRDDDWRYRSSYARNTVIAYSDDGCSREITEVKAQDDCRRFDGIFGNEKVWSVSVNGQCVDIIDTTFRNSCNNLRNLSMAQVARSQDLVLYTDDGCSNKLADLDPGVDCKAMAPIYSGKKIWSVRFDNRCVNIADTTFSEQICNKYQDSVLARYENDGSRRRGDTVELFTDDGCSNSLATIIRGDKCEALEHVYGSSHVWSVRFRGQCVNIQDTTFANACQSYR